MTDIVVRLREWAKARDKCNKKPGRYGNPLKNDPLLEAADEIVHLRTELQYLKEKGGTYGNPGTTYIRSAV